MVGILLGLLALALLIWGIVTLINGGVVLGIILIIVALVIGPLGLRYRA